MDLFRKTALAAAVAAAVSSSYAATKTPTPTILSQGAPQWQRAVAVAGDGNGLFIHVWDNNGTLYAQYSQAGVAQSTPFKIGTFRNTERSVYQGLSVAMNAAGDAVVTWDSQARRIPAHSTSEPVTAVLELPNVQTPQVAMDSGGNFMVVGRQIEYENVRTKQLRYDYNGNPSYLYSYERISHIHPVVHRFNNSDVEQPIKTNTGTVAANNQLDTEECRDKNNRSSWKTARNGGNTYGDDFNNSNYGYGYTENLVNTD